MRLLKFGSNYDKVFPSFLDILIGTKKPKKIILTHSISYNEYFNNLSIFMKPKYKYHRVKIEYDISFLNYDMIDNTKTCFIYEKRLYLSNNILNSYYKLPFSTRGTIFSPFHNFLEDTSFISYNLCKIQKNHQILSKFIYDISLYLI